LNFLNQTYLPVDWEEDEKATEDPYQEQEQLRVRTREFMQPTPKRRAHPGSEAVIGSSNDRHNVSEEQARRDAQNEEEFQEAIRAGERPRTNLNKKRKREKKKSENRKNKHARNNNHQI
jgi:hypothetical protein